MILPACRYLGAFAALGLTTSILAAQHSPQRIAVETVRETGTVNATSEAVFGRLVTVDLNGVSVEAAVKAVVANAGARVTYRTPQLRSASQVVTLHAQKMKLGDALAVVLEGTSLRAEAVTAEVIAITRVGMAATDGVIVGRVIDKATERPVPDATVTIAGGKLTARTGKDGTFRIVGVPPGEKELFVRRLSYTVSRQTVIVGDGATVTANVALMAAATPLEDVVTTVTGPQRRMELGHDVGVIKADSLVKLAPITTMSDLLMSRVPGLAVRQGQGTVGGDVKLQIRGPSSIKYSDEPIVVVDGIRYNSTPPRNAIYDGGGVLGGFTSRELVSPLNDLNPNDVETVEVIKGPSAATLYGPDAANGVIVITTKRGKAGPPRWNVYGTRDYTTIPREDLRTDVQYYGWGRRPNGQVTSCSISDRLNGYCSTFDSLVVKHGLNSIESLSLFKPTYPWTVGANVSGGPQALRYFMGGSYQNAEGAISVPDTVRTLLRAQGAVLPKEFLRPNGQTMLNLKANVTASAGTKTDLTVDGYYTRANTRTIDASLGALDVFRRDNVNTDNGVSPLKSLILDAFSGVSEEANNRFVVNGTALFRAASWLSGNGNVGIDQAARNKTQFQERDSTRSFGAYPWGRAYNGDYTTSIITGNGSVVAHTQRGWLSAQTSIGVQYVRQTDNILEVYGEDLVPGMQSVNFTASQYPNQAYIQSITLGTFAEQRLGLNERLFLTASVRADGSSAFGERYHAATYPKFGVSWLASEEPLFPHIPGLTEFRLRGAYGVAGRHPNSTDKLPMLTIGNDPFACLDNSRCLSQTIGNPDLRPERSTEREGGIDAGLFGARAQLGLTWHQRKTRDLILNELLPMGGGNRLVNLGLTTQHGFEMTLTGMVIATRPMSLSFSFNHSNYETKLNELGDVQPTYRVNGGYVEGYPLGARFVQRYIGYEDKNGDGMLFRSFDPTNNEVFFGSSDPDSLVYGGVADPPRRQNLVLTLGLLSDQVRFSANVAREGGNTVVVPGCITCRAAVDSTAPLAEQAFVARINNGGLVTSATFTRLREVSASVTLPPRTLRLLRASSGSIALTARNLGLWTKTKMSDPESGVVANGKPGWSAIGIPQSKQWALRFDLGL